MQNYIGYLISQQSTDRNLYNCVQNALMTWGRGLAPDPGDYKKYRSLEPFASKLPRITPLSIFQQTQALSYIPQEEVVANQI